MKNDLSENYNSSNIQVSNNSLVNKTINKIIEFQHSSPILSLLKSNIIHKNIKIKKFIDKNEIELKKCYPHLDKQELEEFNQITSSLSTCTPQFSSIYSPIKHILYRDYFDGLSFNFRCIPDDRFIFKYSFKSQELSVNDYNLMIIPSIYFNTKSNQRLNILRLNLEFLRYTFNFRILFPLFEGTIFVYNAKYNILNERKNEFQFYGQYPNFSVDFYHSNKLKILSTSFHIRKGYNIGFQLRNYVSKSNFKVNEKILVRIAAQMLIKDWIQLFIYYKQNSKKLLRIGLLYSHDKNIISAVEALFEPEILPTMVYGMKFKLRDNTVYSSINSNGLISSNYSIVLSKILKVDLKMTLNPFESLDLKQRNFGIGIEFFP